MAGELDDIRLSEECPRCGASVVTSYGVARIHRAAACKCGALLRLDLSGGDITEVQRLIDEQNPPGAAND